MVVGQGRELLARARTVHAIARSRHQAGDNGALDQALGIDDRIVVLRPQGRAGAAPLGTGESLQRSLAPAPQGHGDYPVHGAMPGGNLRKRLLHDPVEADTGPGRRGIAQRRQGVDNIPEGGQLYHQHLHRGSAPASSASSAPATRSTGVSRIQRW